MTQKRKRLLLLVPAIALAVYVASYLLNSWAGGYKFLIIGTFSNPAYEITDAHGVHIRGGAIAWHPLYGEVMQYPPYRDAIGKFYMPLIMLDRRFVHPDITTNDVKSFEELLARVPESKMHPETRKLGYPYGRGDEHQ